MNDDSSLVVTDVAPTEVRLTPEERERQKYEEFRKEWDKAAQQDLKNYGIDPQEHGFEKPEEEKPNLSDLSNVRNETPTVEDNERVDTDEHEEEVEIHGPIPKKRFNKEIEKRKALEAELARERESRIKYETELSLYNKALEELNKKTETKQDVINPIDEESHNYYMKKIQDLESRIENQSKNFTQAQVQKQFETTLNYQQDQFSKSNPDFNDAYQHLIQTEMDSYKMAGYDEQEAALMTQQQLASRAWNAYNKGTDVAEMFYNTAKRYGYAAKPAVAPKPVNTPNLNKIEQNMRKSETLLNDVPEVTTKFAPETESFVRLQGFDRLMNKSGRGVNSNEFHKILEKLRNGV